MDVHFEVNGPALEGVGSGQWAVGSEEVGSFQPTVGSEQSAVDSEESTSVDVEVHFEVDGPAMVDEVGSRKSEVDSEESTSLDVDVSIETELPEVTGNAARPVAPVKPEMGVGPTGEARISAYSLSGLKARKELEKQQAARPSSDQQLPTEPFNETDLMLQWNKYAQRLSDKGQKIMESLMLISDPKLDGARIIHELPNGSAAGEFEDGKLELLGYLRGKLHNHDITIDVIINEKMDNRRAFTAQDKYNRLNEINPNLDLLRRTFDLDLQ